MEGWIDSHTNRWMDRWIIYTQSVSYGWISISIQMNGWMARQIDKQLYEWMDGQRQL